MKTKVQGKLSYASDFLQQISDDLRQLAEDHLAAGGKAVNVTKLTAAARVVETINFENSQP